MRNIEVAKSFLCICDYFGYFKGKTYYIHKLKKGYMASTGGIYCTKFYAKTLKELSTTLEKV